MSKIGNKLPRELITDAAQGHLEPIRDYLDHNKKFKIDSRDLNGRTLLIYATKGEHISLVKFLLDKEANLEVTDHDEKTALIYAADRGLISIVKLFVERKANLDHRDKEGKTALIYATISNRSEMVKYLLECGAQINLVDVYGRAAISYATFKKLPVLKILLDFKPTIDIIETDGNTPLMNACRKANLEHVQLLLEHKADPNIQEMEGWTALFHAAWFCRRDVLEALVKAGADVKMKDNRGLTAMSYAVQANNRVAVDFLTEQRLVLPDENPSISITTKVDGSVGSSLSDTEIQHALRTGKKPWGRCKIMIVGEGRAGKTALANSMMGKSFSQTSSTIGIQTVSCNVGYGSADGKSWQAAHQAEQQLESAVASMIANQRNNRPPTSTSNHNLPATSKDASIPVCLDENHSQSHTKTGKVAEDADVVVSEASSTKPPSTEDIAIATQVEEIIHPISSINEEVVMKCLNNDVALNCKYNVSLYDFGGQSVFNVIHPFFLSRYGVYLICFNMEWFMNPRSPEEYNRAIDTISFWLNSIIIHTQDSEEHLPPIAFVGTRKDTINNVVAHELISTLLYDTFSNSVAWPYVIENSAGQGKDGRVNFCFFPVDNLLGKDDTTLQYLLTSIEKELDQAEYIHQLVSLSWFRFYDMMMSTQKSFLSFQDVEQISKSCGIATKTLPQLLHFLHEMGMVMWHDEAHLRHIVILNPIEYFVVPATIVICKHEPTIADSTYHSLAIHKKVRKFHKREWDEMVKFGIISQKLLNALLEGYSQEDVKMLIQLMLKYGLIVKVHSSLDKDDINAFSNSNTYGMSRTESLDEELVHHGRSHEVVPSTTRNDQYEVMQYLAPALLPTKTMEDHLSEHRTNFYFLFSTSPQVEQQTLFNWQDCKLMGFLPNGLFEQIISQAISWSQQTSSLEMLHMQLYAISKNDVTLAFGNQMFRMKVYPSHHLIEVIVEGKSPVGIYVRLREQIKRLLSSGTKKLKFVTLLPFAEDLKASPHLHAVSDTEKLLIRLSEIQAAMERHSVLSLAGGKGRKVLSSQDIDQLYNGWLDKFHRFEAYDIFFSYRWNVYDSHIAQALFDHLSLYTITSEFRAIRTFLDLHKLEKGVSFQADLGKSLIHSSIIVPIISTEGLQRCVKHDANHVDNMLLEWILAISCVRSLMPETTKVKKIIPLLVGSTAHDIVSNLFKDDVLNRISTVTPSATIMVAKDLLKSNNVTFNDHDISQLTVKEVVNEMLRHLGMEVWTFNETVNYNQRNLIVTLSEKLKEELESVISANHAATHPRDNPHRRGSVTESIKTNLRNAHLTSLASNDDNLTMNKELSLLSLHEVETLYLNIGLGMYIEEVQKNSLDGEALVQCKTEDDLKEAGITKAFHARKLLNYIDSWQKEGVPPQVLIERSSI